MASQTAPLILVVEDDPAVLASLNFSLEAEGFKVCACDSVMRLLAADWPPEIACLVVDYGMPTMNGIDLLRHLRNQQMLVPAILITGHSDEIVRDRALAAGFVRIVNKPLRGNVLIEEIRHVLAIT
jgi:two-component system, LuxR family, response regulator FixJ